jgi:hypothetical protein
VQAHLIDCTYCDQRLVTPGDKKRNLHEVERCKRTMTLLPHPSKPGRWCAAFHQVGHQCKSCLTDGG